jgi:hypothetical protein
MKKILVITDSLGLPRPTPEIVKYNETWVYKLSEVYNVHQISIGGAIIEDLGSQINYAKMFEPDIVILQSGIVDCAPRAMTKNETRILNKFKFTRILLKKALKPKVLFFLRKHRNITYTHKKIFETQVVKFHKHFQSKLFWIEILPASIEFNQSIPGIETKIKEYNNIIQEIVKENLILVPDFKADYLMSDHHHLSKAGHVYIFNKIIDKLSEKINE